MSIQIKFEPRQAIERERREGSGGFAMAEHKMEICQLEI